MVYNMIIFDDFYFLPYGFSPNIAILQVAPAGHHYGYWSRHTRDASCQEFCSQFEQLNPISLVLKDFWKVWDAEKTRLENFFLGVSAMIFWLKMRNINTAFFQHGSAQTKP